jgi:deoxyribonuclease-4
MINQLIGAHISTAGGVSRSIERALSVGCTTMQIFTKSNRSWFDKPITPEEVAAFRKAYKESKMSEAMIHTSYLINIGAKEAATENNSVKALTQELERAQALGIPYLVLHPGSHTGAGTEVCLKKIARNLDEVLKSADGKTIILIETMAGQGTNVGSTFEEIKEILNQAQQHKLLGVCFDTCHAFCAGYEISTDEGYEKTFQDFDRIIGLTHLRAFHVNDSKTALNSRKDRHEELGKGNIPLTFFKKLVNDIRFVKIPKILETPTDPEMDLYRREIKLLHEMISLK